MREVKAINCDSCGFGGDPETFPSATPNELCTGNIPEDFAEALKKKGWDIYNKSDLNTILSLCMIPDVNWRESPITVCPECGNFTDFDFEVA